jgi:hypothetical protein
LQVCPGLLLLYTTLFQTGSDAEELVLRPKELYDNATPSGNSVAAETLLRLVSFTGDAEYERAGLSALRLIRDILAFEPAGRGTNIGGATEYLNKMLAHKAIIFLVSDFLGEDIERPLKLLAQRHDVVAVTVEDPSERLLPDIGLVRLVDPESGQALDVDTSNAAVRERFDREVSFEADRRRHLLRRLAIDEIPVRTDRGIMEPLLRFFRARETRIRT